MSYTTGAQGTQGGPQGPQTWGSSNIIWGPQGPVAGKQPPFAAYNSEFDVMNMSLRLIYTTRCGTKFALVTNRTITSEADLLNLLPDDMVQLCNLIDFRPHHGYYMTVAGGQNKYKVIEITSSNDPLENMISAVDTSTKTYIANETGL